MKQKTTDILKKTVSVSGITCIALGSTALIASGAALKALTEGAGFLKNAVRAVLAEKPRNAFAETEAIQQTSEPAGFPDQEC